MQYTQKQTPATTGIIHSFSSDKGEISLVALRSPTAPAFMIYGTRGYLLKDVEFYETFDEVATRIATLLQ